MNHREEIRRIMICVNRIDGIYDISAKNSSIKSNTLALLYALDGGKQHTQKEICENRIIPVTTINTIVKECVADGYITLETGNRSREKNIRITERGKEYAQAVLKQTYDMEQATMEKTLADFSNEFISVLEQFISNLKEELCSNVAVPNKKGQQNKQ